MGRAVNHGDLIYPSSGVLERTDGDFPDSRVVKHAILTNNGPLFIKFADDSSDSYPVSSGNLEPYNFGRVSFKTDTGESYHIRALGEEDGEWASKFRMRLPGRAIDHLFAEDPDTDESAGYMAYLQDEREVMVAFTYPDDEYIMGVLYINKFGAYARFSGEWIALAGEDETFDDTVPYYVNPGTVDRFLAAVDHGPVSVDEVREMLTTPQDKAASRAKPVEEPEPVNDDIDDEDLDHVDDLS